MSRQYRAFRRLYRFLYALMRPFLWIRFTGRENIPPGAAVFCANHSSNLDPIVQAIACGIGTHLHFMAKAELFSFPVVGRVLHAIGSYPVNRGQTDVSAVRTSLKYLRAGEKIAIYPEGRRVRREEAAAAKHGALRLADQTSAPVVPVFIQTTKRPFKPIAVVIGRPYDVNPGGHKLLREDYDRLAADLMERIAALGAGSRGCAGR